jgi:hypothetical protein
MPVERLNQNERAFRAWRLLTAAAANRSKVTHAELADALQIHPRPSERTESRRQLSERLRSLSRSMYRVPGVVAGYSTRSASLPARGLWPCSRASDQLPNRSGSAPK